jgi:hypothetical protein
VYPIFDAPVVLLDVEKPRVLPSTRQSAEESKRHHSGERREFHQRSWWIVHIQPTKGLPRALRNPTNTVVDRSYPA